MIRSLTSLGLCPHGPTPSDSEVYHGDTLYSYGVLPWNDRDSAVIVNFHSGCRRLAALPLEHVAKGIAAPFPGGDTSPCSDGGLNGDEAGRRLDCSAGR